MASVSMCIMYILSETRRAREMRELEVMVSMIVADIHGMHRTRPEKTSCLMQLLVIVPY